MRKQANEYDNKENGEYIAQLQITKFTTCVSDNKEESNWAGVCRMKALM